MRAVDLLRRHGPEVVFGVLLGVLVTLGVACLLIPESAPVTLEGAWEP